MIKEFRDFIAKGNMVEIAVGLLIAASFTGVVAALTKDMINPIIGLFGKVDFGNLGVVIKDPKGLGPYSDLATADKSGAIILRYGDFISTLINFLITAFVVFLILKAVSKMIKKPEPVTVVADPEPTKEEVLLAEIRDLLKVR